MCHACDNFFSCDHTVLRTLLSICLSVHPSVSVTPFPQCPCHHIMKFSAVITFDKSDVHTKGQGEMSFISRGSLLFIFKASSKFQGHLGQKIYKMFPDCKSSLNSQMHKACSESIYGGVWIIPSFQVWDYVLHVEHVTHVIKLNSLRPGRNEQHFADDIFKRIFFNENVWISIFSNVFSSMKMFEFRLKFHWSLFPRVQLTMFQHWFR